jgi:hypothetical protein
MKPPYEPPYRPIFLASTALLLHQPFLAVEQVLQFRMAHLPIDGRAPIAPIARRGAVVHVEHHIALAHQPAVEHLFAEIIRVVHMHVLHVPAP